MAIAAIARRRKLLNDEVITSLADTSWQILDISGSDVSDSGLAEVAKMCKSLQAVDIRYRHLDRKYTILVLCTLHSRINAIQNKEGVTLLKSY